jgi:hypothetical protein
MIPFEVKFGSSRDKKWILDTVDFRVPKVNELYINKNNEVQRNKSIRFSKRSQKRIIVKESWRRND